MRHRVQPLIYLAVVALVAPFTACKSDKQNASQPQPPKQIYHIKADALVAPGETPSVGNSPAVLPSMNEARLDTPDGFHIDIWASELNGPRQAIVASNGDVLLAETYGGNITVLRDADNDGKAEFRAVFLSGLRQPFGIEIHGEWLYIGCEDKVVRVPYVAGQEVSTTTPEVIVRRTHDARRCFLSRRKQDVRLHRFRVQQRRG